MVVPQIVKPRMGPGKLCIGECETAVELHCLLIGIYDLYPVRGGEMRTVFVVPGAQKRLVRPEIPRRGFLNASPLGLVERDAQSLDHLLGYFRLKREYVVYY